MVASLKTLYLGQPKQRECVHTLEPAGRVIEHKEGQQYSNTACNKQHIVIAMNRCIMSIWAIKQRHYKSNGQFVFPRIFVGLR